MIAPLNRVLPESNNLQELIALEKRSYNTNNACRSGSNPR